MATTIETPLTEEQMTLDILQAVNDDLRETKEWRDGLLALRLKRLGARKRNNLYPKAPDFYEPIIDDNVRAFTNSEVNLLFNPRRLVSAIPMTPSAAQYAADVANGFDLLMRMTNNVRAKLESLMDMKNADGMSIAKVVPNTSSYGRIFGDKRTIPDFEVRDPTDIIVPTSTQDIQDAERLCDIMRWSPKKLLREAKLREWGHEGQRGIDLLNKINPGRRGEGGVSESSQATSGGGEKNIWGDEQGGAPLMIGLNQVADTLDYIIIWEVYYFDRNGNKRKRMFSPQAPEILLEDSPWENIPKIITGFEDETSMPFEQEIIIERQWPHVQLRFEDRNLFYYDTRGGARLLLQNQNSATQYLVIRGIQYDYVAMPLLKGSSDIGGLEQFKFRPGAKLPEGVEVAQLQPVDQSLTFNADQERQLAARRMGSNTSSLTSTARRGGKSKTATEVNATNIQQAALSSASVMRVSEPLTVMFNMMWQRLFFNPVPLPMFRQVGEHSIMEFASEDIFNEKFLMQSSVSGRDANPDFKLQQLVGLQPMLMNLESARQSELGRMMIDLVDPAWTDRIIVSEKDAAEGGASMEKKVDALMQAVEQIGQTVGAQQEFLQSIAQAEAEEVPGNGQAARAPVSAQ